MKFAKQLYEEIHEAMLNDQPDYDIIEQIEDTIINTLPFNLIEKSLAKTYIDDYESLKKDYATKKDYIEAVTADIEDIALSVIKEVERELLQ